MIWLLRHGDAAKGSPDESRPLTALGKLQSRCAGLALAGLGVKIEACMSSPKLRALQTAKLACEPLGVDVEDCPALAGDRFDPSRLAAGRGEVLLVGHDPSMSRALHHSTGAHVSMRKGAIAAIDGRELVTLLRPSELLAIAGNEVTS
jgi:phosphohistidine phosphatase SixA